MKKTISKTGERIIPENFESKEEYLLYLRHLFAYDFAKKQIPPKSIVLEVGTGEGYGTNFLSKSENVNKIIGIDVDKNSIIHSKRKYQSEKCEFKLYDGKKIPFKENTFDVIISYQVIEHIKNDKNYVSEIYRVLKKGGKFLIATPNRIYRLKPGQKPWNRFHIREYSPKTLAEILKTKFNNIELMGIIANQEVQQIEIDRIKKNLKIIKLDPLNLRKLIPESFKPLIINTLRKILSKKTTNKKDFSKYNLNCFNILKESLKNSLELMAVCKK